MKIFRLIAVLMISIMTMSFSGCFGDEEIQIEIDDNAYNNSENETETTHISTVKVGTLKGPTGVGALRLMELEEKEETYEYNSYKFTATDSTDELVAKFTNDEVDIVAIPTNLASVLYNKTNGNVQIAAINTLGALNIVENGDTIKTIKDLSNKTIYATSKGAVPEYVLNHLLKENSVENVTIEYKEPSELSSLMAAGEISIGMLPEPQCSIAMSKNPNLKISLNITDEWKKTVNSDMTTGCIAVKKDYADKHPRVFGHFLQDYYNSIMYSVKNVSETAKLAEKFKIIPKADIAEKAIPNCNIVYIDGEEMKTSVTNFLTVLYNSNPDSIGGKIPADDFFYTPKEKYAVKK
ncbi:MAG: ABC transporter substrate-binding protein [Clostridiales bacterium]|nr:ABC transporter substrate-binding protein [Clostridiales bacterium]